MKRHLLAMSLLFMFILALSHSALAQQNAEAGDYYVTGVGMNGTPYEGGLEILTVGADQYYTLAWQLANPFYGIGILNGNVLSGAFGGDGCAVATYTLDANSGAIDGAWASTNDGRLGYESGKPTQSSANVTEYTLTGTDPDGTPYTGTMTVTQTADTAQLVQNFGGSMVYGTAILQGNVISAVYGNDSCGVLGYIVGENRLDGEWTTFGSTTRTTETAQSINIAGSHNITGINPDGSTYSGTLQITPNNQVHNFLWNINGAIQGVGILRGSMVSVGFGGPECSVASYMIMPDGKLQGLLTRVGLSVVGTEVALPDNAAVYQPGAYLPDVAGTYSVVGTNPGDTSGTTYQGRLQIIPHDQVYQFLWDFNGSQDQGVAIESGNILLVGYGGENCGVNAYRVLPNSMVGAFALYGVNTLGQETATR